MNTYIANTSVDFGRGIIAEGEEFEADIESVQGLIDNGSISDAKAKKPAAKPAATKPVVKDDAPAGNAPDANQDAPEGDAVLTKAQMIAELEMLGKIKGEDFDPKATNAILLELLEATRKANEEAPATDE